MLDWSLFICYILTQWHEAEECHYTRSVFCFFIISHFICFGAIYLVIVRWYFAIDTKNNKISDVFRLFMSHQFKIQDQKVYLTTKKFRFCEWFSHGSYVWSTEKIARHCVYHWILLYPLVHIRYDPTTEIPGTQFEKSNLLDALYAMYNHYKAFKHWARTFLWCYWKTHNHHWDILFKRILCKIVWHFGKFVSRCHFCMEYTDVWRKTD